jgi:putative hydrolase of the HAD superfamily
MADIEVVSFDMEGTLIDDGYSNLIWETDIPRLYGEKHGMDLDVARTKVLGEYAKVGEDRPEWYDIDYWFKRLGLDVDWRELLRQREGACRVYGEVPRVLERMRGEYTLIVSSNTIREFLDVQLTKLPDVFAKVYSAPSDLKTVKKTDSFYRRICEEMGVNPSSMAHVGDSLKFDYEEPRKLGIRSFYLDRKGESSGVHSVHDLDEFEEKLRFFR